MKIKFSKEVCLIALAALLALPLQQLLLKQKAKAVSALQKSFVLPEEGRSESALSGNSGGVIFMVNSNFQRQFPAAAEAWLKFGAYQLQSPSVMLVYGDWEKQRGKRLRAEYFYRFALRKARREKAPANFIRALEIRLGNLKK